MKPERNSATTHLLLNPDEINFKMLFKEAKGKIKLLQIT